MRRWLRSGITVLCVGGMVGLSAAQPPTEERPSIAGKLSQMLQAQVEATTTTQIKGLMDQLFQGMASGQALDLASSEVQAALDQIRCYQDALAHLENLEEALTPMLDLTTLDVSSCQAACESAQQDTAHVEAVVADLQETLKACQTSTVHEGAPGTDEDDTGDEETDAS